MNESCGVGFSSLSDQDDDIDDYMDDLSDESDSEIPASHGGQFADDIRLWNGNRRVVSQLIDIQEPLHKLKSLLEDQLQCNFDGYNFWLQDSQQLADDKSLTDHCIQGEGLVQINVQIKDSDDEDDDEILGSNNSGAVISDANCPYGKRRINIIDVIMPNVEEETTDININNIPHQFFATSNDTANLQSDTTANSSDYSAQQPLLIPNPVQSTSNSPIENIRWIISNEFKNLQRQHGIAEEVTKWSDIDVLFWITWVERNFTEALIQIENWNKMSGVDLDALSFEQFQAKVPSDPGDLVWTHLELLRKCKCVAVVDTKRVGERTSEKEEAIEVSEKMINQALGRPPIIKRKQFPTTKKSSTYWPDHKKSGVRLGLAKISVMSSDSNSGNRSGSNGQVQLWQFLLELLTSHQYLESIHWCGDEGQFKFADPKHVAWLWGQKKRKHEMNYEKMSRALRYYYDGDMISKVQGQKFMYQFVCDLKQLMGFSATELNELVLNARKIWMVRNNISTEEGENENISNENTVSISTPTPSTTISSAIASICDDIL